MMGVFLEPHNPVAGHLTVLLNGVIMKIEELLPNHQWKGNN
jgi:hypothetical protein